MVINRIYNNAALPVVVTVPINRLGDIGSCLGCYLMREHRLSKLMKLDLYKSISFSNSINFLNFFTIFVFSIQISFFKSS